MDTLVCIIILGNEWSSPIGMASQVEAICRMPDLATEVIEAMLKHCTLPENYWGTTPGSIVNDEPTLQR